MLHRIALSGKAGSGKDTVADILTRSDDWVRVAFADAIKETALLLDPYVSLGDNAYVKLKFLVDTLGWDYAKSYSDVRRILQHLGIEAGRNVHGEDCWLNIAKEKAFNAWLAKKSVIFTDMRFMNEFIYLKDHGYTVVKLIRETSIDCRENLEHESECNLDNVLYKDWDFIIHNDGSLDNLSLINELVNFPEKMEKELHTLDWSRCCG